MLVHLSVRDFAIVERLELELAGGMTVLTGETGAGKSILVDALGLALGTRASATVVRTGAEQSEVVAIFDIEHGSDAEHLLEEQALASEERECIVRRLVGADGRSRAFVNARPVPLHVLRALGETLVDIHGQHEHQSLLKRDVQRRILDEFGGHEPILAALGEVFDRLRGARDELDALAGDPREHAERLDYLRHQVRELDALGLTPQELETIGEDHRRLAHASELLEACGRVLDDLDGDSDFTAGARMAGSLRALENVTAVDASAEPIRALLADALVGLREAAAALRRYRDGIDLDPERLAALESRLAAIHDAARKHHVPAAELPRLHRELAERIAALEGAAERVETLQREIALLERDYRETARTLHERRVASAAALAAKITENMHALGMSGGELTIDVEADDAAPPARHGTDTVTFLVAVNPGHARAPLARVASGGELSRISLAIQVIATRASGVPTLIFDEVDAGVGGRVAEIVGRELRRLAATRQVMCVTHLPQVASQADHHVQVSKRTERQAVHADLSNLTGESRVQEIARMLGGVTITDQTLAHAREMLERA
ncbi:MAG: DNA repair protein RecN [Gammaproteobacteria bacterium]|nr:DNA repair protein RecN [Gammaproteobacteria bacterium]